MKGAMKKLPSHMTHQFSEVPNAEIQRSQFDRSHTVKTTFNAGLLIPIYLDEALPGDTFNLNMTGFARLATPIKPFMDNLHMETFFFAVPNRLIWDNWQKFNGEQDSPGDSTDYVVPQTTLVFGGYSSESLGDYFGLPVGSGTGVSHSDMWHRAYKLIWNEWFRDQNLQDSIVIDKSDTGAPSNVDEQPLPRGKRYDYFTSCLPWPQKGDAVTIPLSGVAPVYSDQNFGGSGIPFFKNVNDEGTFSLDTNDGTQQATWSVAQTIDSPAKWNIPSLVADLSSLNQGWTINQMREAFQLQRMLEKDARGGTRYTEVIKAHFGVTSPDARLQRPEFLGGGYTPVNVSPVAQTQATPTADGDTPQANLAAIGTASLHGHGFVKSFTEHCTLLGLVCVRADITYQQGLDRMWSRSTRYDFYWPTLAHLGEQAVFNKEIYCIGGAEDDLVFGYQERYAEYRYKQSKITGKFRSNINDTLDVWHLAQYFTNRPTLDETFIEENPPIDRVIAVQDEPHFLFDAYFKLKTARPMPLYGVPGKIDQF